MLKKIKQAIITTVASLAFLTPLAVPVMVHAQTTDLQKQICAGSSDLKISTTQVTGDKCDAGTTESGAEGSVNKLIKLVINVFSGIVGIVAVIMIVFGGFKYITSGGNDGNVSTAKNTILYAVIGLIIVALAQLVVRYVLGKAVSIQ